jgi:ribosomal protein L22
MATSTKLAAAGIPTTGKTNERPGTRAMVRHVRMSATKARVVLDLIRNKDVQTADEILKFSERDAAIVIRKLLHSAVANAEHNDEQIVDDLYVSACFADEGKTLRRFRPRARGRATRIRKRTCHITIIVSRLPDDLLELLSGDPSGARAGALRVLGPLAGELLLGQAAHDDRDVARALADARRTAARTRTEPAQRLALVGEARRDVQVVADLLVVVLGVGHRAAERLADDDRGIALGELEDLVGRLHVLAADQVEHDPRLGCRHAHVAHDGLGAGALVRLAGGGDALLRERRRVRHGYRRPFADFSWPAWYRNVRVGANSPSL